MEEAWKAISQFFDYYGWRILIAICFLLLWIIIVQLLGGLLKRILYKTTMDDAAVSFFDAIVKIVLWVCGVFIAAAILEFSTGSIVVALSSVALVIALSLKDSFSNLANGILIIINKPFRRGDWIKVDGFEGVVQSIKLMHTEIVDFDNKMLIVPNSKITTSTLVNFSALPTRRVDMVFSVSYEADMDKVKEVLLSVVTQDDLVLTNPEPKVFMSAHSSSSVDWTVRAWTETDNYFALFSSLPEKVFSAFKTAKISIPYPQLDVHFDKERRAKGDK